MTTTSDSDAQTPNNTGDNVSYPFRLVSSVADDAKDPLPALGRRPLLAESFHEEAAYFIPGDHLETAINTAIAIGEPLLLTGESGTGKTQTAYYVARKLGLSPVIHFQVKSETRARDLLYDFDMVRYFRDAHIAGGVDSLDKTAYRQPRALWEALAAKTPRVVLIDEIDKAPSDFPNDLLHELDRMEFTIPETGETISGQPETRPIVIITSNSERRLPEPFLRRCAYFHITFDKTVVRDAVAARADRHAALAPSLTELAIDRFFALRELPLRKKPSTGELLVWLRVLALREGIDEKKLERRLRDLPGLEVLVKDRRDLEEIDSARDTGTSP